MLNQQIHLLREYASHRRFVKAIAETAQHPSAQAASFLLSNTTEISEGTPEDEQTFAQCALVWNGDSFASGIYLGGRIVLTARHVIVGVHPITVSIGISSIDQRFGPNDYAVSSWVQPAMASIEWDVAILVLENPGPTTPAVRLGTTQDIETARAAAGGAGVTVCGFGWGWPVGHPEQLAQGIKRSIAVPFSDLPAPRSDPDNFFVAGDGSATAPFQNICQFDSGAPAFTGDSNSMTLLGIASGTVDVDAQTRDGCGTKPLGIFSRIDVGREWIQGVIDQHEP